jgi:hypothetical protein
VGHYDTSDQEIFELLANSESAELSKGRGPDRRLLFLNQSPEAVMTHKKFTSMYFGILTGKELRKGSQRGLGSQGIQLQQSQNSLSFLRFVVLIFIIALSISTHTRKWLAANTGEEKNC